MILVPDFSGFFGTILAFLFIGYLYHCYKHQNDDDYKRELIDFIDFYKNFMQNKSDENTYSLSRGAIKFGLKHKVFKQLFEYDLTFTQNLKNELLKKPFADVVEITLK